MLFRISVVVAAGACAFAQEKPAPDLSGTRALYYNNRVDNETLRPVLRKTSAPSRPAPPSTGSAASEPAVNVPHLGLRYTVLLVDTKTNRTQAVDSDRIFRKGECFALEIEANRAGYLYVMAKQSSGNWQAMYPSALMENESNVIGPNRKARIPQEYCFEVEDPAGEEQLFVVLSRDPEDLYKLHEAIRTQGSSPAPQPARPASPAYTQMASARIVNDEVSRLAQMGTRDLVIRKVDKPADSRDQPHSVFVVNSSARPSPRVIATVVVRHR